MDTHLILEKHAKYIVYENDLLNYRQTDSQNEETNKEIENSYTVRITERLLYYLFVIFIIERKVHKLKQTVR